MTTPAPHTTVSCPFCHTSQQVALYFSRDDKNVYHCSKCNVEFLHPQPSDSALAGIYSEQYFLGSETTAGIAHAAQLKRSTASLYLTTIRETLQVSVPTMFEIGCGSGDFLLEAQSTGFIVEGLEYSGHAAAVANHRLGKDAVITGSLETTRLAPEAYDLIVGFDVIEHMRDPALGMSLLRRSLKNNGVLVLATPSLDSWSKRLLGKHWMEYKTEHLFYFSRSSLKYLLEGLGYTNVRFKPNYKILSAAYIVDHFQRYPVPIITPLLSFLRRLLPRHLATRPFHVVASGMMVLADKGCAANRTES